MSLVFEEEYAVEWCVNEREGMWSTLEVCDSLAEAKDLAEFDSKHHPETKCRVAVRYVSEWKPWGGE